MTKIAMPDGTGLEVRDLGEGRPLVFLHGWTIGSELWERQLATLPDRFRCVAYDRRGCGRSDRPWNGYDYDTLADDLHTVLEYLDLTNVTLVAHSMAAGEAVRLLGRHGAGRVAAVVLVAPATPALLPADALDAMVAAMHADLPGYLRAGAPQFFGLTAGPALVDWGVGLAARASLRASAELTRTLARTDLRAELAAVNVPVIVVHGDADESAPLELTGRPTAEAIPDAQLVVVEGAPHGLPLTHPAPLEAVLVDVAITAAAAVTN